MGFNADNMLLDRDPVESRELIYYPTVLSYNAGVCFAL